MCLTFTHCVFVPVNYVKCAEHCHLVSVTCVECADHCHLVPVTCVKCAEHCHLVPVTCVKCADHCQSKWHCALRRYEFSRLFSLDQTSFQVVRQMGCRYVNCSIFKKKPIHCIIELHYHNLCNQSALNDVLTFLHLDVCFRSEIIFILVHYYTLYAI